MKALLFAWTWLALSGCSRKPDPAAGVASGAGQATPLAPRAAASAGDAPLLLRGKPTGYSQLPDGLVFRTSKQECPSARPRQEECRSTRPRCMTDAECEAKPNGHCTDLGDTLGCGCQYGCLSDEECGQNEVCLCGDPVGTCVATTCTDNTCSPKSRCSTYHDGCSYKPFACLEKAGERSCNF